MNVFFALLLLDFWAPLNSVPEEVLLKKGFRVDANHGLSPASDSGTTLTSGARSLQDARYEPIAEGYLARDGVLISFAIIPKRSELARQLTKALPCKPLDRASSGPVECDVGITPWTVRVCDRAMILHDQSKEAISSAEATCEVVLSGTPR